MPAREEQREVQDRSTSEGLGIIARGQKASHRTPKAKGMEVWTNGVKRKNESVGPLINADNLCSFTDDIMAMQLPNHKTLKITFYSGNIDINIHLKRYNSHLLITGSSDATLCSSFARNLARVDVSANTNIFAYRSGQIEIYLSTCIEETDKLQMM